MFPQTEAYVILFVIHDSVYHFGLLGYVLAFIHAHITTLLGMAF
jgi:hypothetical protein